ncbi:MAG: ArnT family glycosyltransferase [Pyrinomonadaceae bacterium]
MVKHLESQKLECVTLSLVLVLFALFSWTSANSERPESDEGGFQSPAYNLINNGNFGTTVYEMQESGLTRIDQRTYWVMPMFLLNSALSFELFGFSVTSMRLVSIFWGLVLLLSWFFILGATTKNSVLSVVSVSFIGLSFPVLAVASIGRPDAMCAALGFAGIASYLMLHKKNHVVALLIANTLVVFSGLTHFLGILGFAGLILVVFVYGRKEIGLQEFLFSVLPYLIGGALFAYWVFQDYTAFYDQFIANAAMHGRLEAFSTPFSVLLNEFTLRYPRAFGLLDISPGHSGPVFLKALILLGYVIGTFATIVIPYLRKRFGIIIGIFLVYFILLSLLDGQKLAAYLVYVVPFYSAFIGGFVYYLWNKTRFPRVLIAVAVIGFWGLNFGGILLRARQNTMENTYLPAVEYLNKNVSPGENVIGSPELRFALDNNIDHIADGEFGMRTGNRPTYIVLDPGVDDSFNDAKKYNPKFYYYLPKMLEQNYTLVYKNEGFRIYKLKTAK